PAAPLPKTFPQVLTSSPRERFAADRRPCACRTEVIRGRGHVECTAIALAYQTFAVGVPLDQLPRCSAAVQSNSVMGQAKTSACIPGGDVGGPEGVRKATKRQTKSG